MNGAASDNPLALGLIIVGAVALAISTFLPLVEPTGTFRTVEHNTLIQRGGWMVIALAFGIAASGYRVSQGRWTARWIPIALCVSTAVLIGLNAPLHLFAAQPSVIQGSKLVQHNGIGIKRVG